MKLYYAPGACSLSSHIALREADRRFELVRVDLKIHRTASGADFLAINPKGSVPALQIAGSGSTVLTDVSEILQYIGDLTPETNLVPPTGTVARSHLQDWLAVISNEIHQPFVPLFDPQTPGGIAQRQRGLIGQQMIHLQDVLDDRAFLMGETFTVADALLFVMLQWCGPHGIDLSLYPNVADYDSRMLQRPAVQAAMAAEGLLAQHRERAARDPGAPSLAARRADDRSHAKW